MEFNYFTIIYILIHKHLRTFYNPLSFKYFFWITSTITVVLSLNVTAFAQDSDKSLALKKNRPQKKYSLFYQPDLSYQIQKRFNLLRDANAGNPLAQHELGLRYLLGEDGLPADTIQGAFWIGKAALQNLTAACYNYGILLLNGWGVEWNPFKAFDFFLKAANDGMAQAQYIIGILYTDNLIVKRNYSAAYNWLAKSAKNDYLPAKETLTELEKYLPPDFFNSSIQVELNNTSNSQSSANNSITSQLGLVFIDFDSLQDTIKDFHDSQLIQDLFHESNLKLADTLGLKIEDTSLTKINFEGIKLIEKFAESGNSEAYTILGRLYEEGIFYEKDLFKAAENYILASQLNYPQAKFLLLKLVSQDFITKLVSEIKLKQNTNAMYVFYGLWSLGLSNSFMKDEAYKFLFEAAKLNHMNSVIELANNYYTRKIDNENSASGIKLWEKASESGSVQAKIRLAAANVFDGNRVEALEESIKTLQNALQMGSVLSQITLAFAYENGIGVAENKSEAAKLYRLAAQRGNLSAYNELKRLYDEIRPNEIRFLIN